MQRAISNIFRLFAVKSVEQASGIPLGGQIFEALHYFVLGSSELPPTLITQRIKNKFLNQDPKEIIALYSDEGLVAKGIPYCTIKEWSEGIELGKSPEIRIKKHSKPFKLANWEDGRANALRDAAFSEFKDSGKMNRDETVIRLHNFSDFGGYSEMIIQRAKYSHQVRSQLILDYQHTEDETGDVITLRGLLKGQFGKSLPPISDPRLANTIGVAAIIFYMDAGQWTPLLVPRSMKTAIFNQGGWHCTASGAVEWPYDAASSFEDIFTSEILKELEEEVGLGKADIKDIVPLALARELTRAGKPQLFFVGRTDLAPDDVKARYEAARHKAKKQHEIVEVNDFPLFRYPATIGSEKELILLFRERGFTTEAAGNLIYFFRARKEIQKRLGI